ncbi:MAG: urease subunit beta [Bacteroides sp.]|nr:urease subunit beta [Bacteroides sp.]
MSKKRVISSFSLLVAFLCVALVGIALIPRLPVKLAPTRTLPGLTVRFSMPGNSARVVEMETTSKLEAMLARIRGIRSIHSNSGNGGGSITLQLDKHADMDVVRFEASTIIRQTWPILPDGVTYPYITLQHSDNEASRPFLTYTVNAPASPVVILQYAEDHIKSRLAQIEGVYEVALSGATPMEWRLTFDSDCLSVLGISLDHIRGAIGRYYNKEFLGIFNRETGAGNEEWIRLALLPEDKDLSFDPSRIQVGVREGKIITLDELVQVVRVEQEPQSYYRINGLNSIYLNITAEESANQLQLGKMIKEELERISAAFPGGYRIINNYDATEYIQQELDKIYFRTILTIIILLVFVFIITLSPRYLFLIVVSLGVNIAVAVIFYYLFGLEMQLYSLAGITVSLNLIIDSTIVMTDHILHKRNLKAFISILAATLTTMGALVIIFFLDEKIRLNLQDFAGVIIINLAVSLFVALFFVPAFIKKSGLGQRRRGRRSLFLKRVAVYITRFYRWLIGKMVRFRIAACVLLVLLFGLPVFMLPDKIDKEGKAGEIYSKTLGNGYYKESIKPTLDKALGGTLRLFIQKVYNGSYFTRNEETILSINATLPNGSTLEQMNTLIQKMEVYLTNFKEIRQFQTHVYNARRASIQVFFTKEHERSGFPYLLKSRVISKVVELEVLNTGTRSIQVGSHCNFAETNRALKFDRRAAIGFRLNIPAGTAVRFEPGESKTVELVEISWQKLIYGGNNLVGGAYEGREDDILVSMKEKGFIQ